MHWLNLLCYYSNVDSLSNKWDEFCVDIKNKGRNSLTEKVVCAPSVNAFENRPDKLWYNHPMKFNPDIGYNPNPLMMTHDPGSQKSAEIQMTDDELNIEAAGLRSEST